MPRLTGYSAVGVRLTASPSFKCTFSEQPVEQKPQPSPSLRRARAAHWNLAQPKAARIEHQLRRERSGLSCRRAVPRGLDCVFAVVDVHAADDPGILGATTAAKNRNRSHNSPAKQSRQHHHAPTASSERRRRHDPGCSRYTGNGHAADNAQQKPPSGDAGQLAGHQQRGAPQRSECSSAEPAEDRRFR